MGILIGFLGEKFWTVSVIQVKMKNIDKQRGKITNTLCFNAGF